MACITITATIASSHVVRASIVQLMELANVPVTIFISTPFPNQPTHELLQRLPSRS